MSTRNLISFTSHDAVNIRAATIHIIGDLVQSIGVLIAGLIIKFVNHDNAWLADPITTLLFMIITIITTIRVVKEGMMIFESLLFLKNFFQSCVKILTQTRT